MEIPSSWDARISPREQSYGLKGVRYVPVVTCQDELSDLFWDPRVNRICSAFARSYGGRRIQR
jgi:hypothetical protein